MIGLELKTYTPKAAGVGRYSLQLVDKLLERRVFDYFGYTSPQTVELKFPLGESQRLLNQQGTIIRSVLIPALFWDKRIRLLHTLDASTFYGIDSKKVKRVTTIHDLIALKFPQYFTRKMRIVLKNRIMHAIQKSDFLIAVSNATKLDLLSCFPKLNEKKIKVIHEASCLSQVNCSDSVISGNLQSFLDKNHLYFLSVATREPRKNLKLTIEAFQFLRKKVNENLRLVLVGQKGWLESAALHESEALLQNVIITGRISDSELKGWYKHALALVYPSFYEGFGLPVLEAMAMGCPVITSNVSSLPEVAGTAAFQVDPYSLADLIQAMQQILESEKLRSDLIDKGLKQSALFSWDKTAELTEQVYQSLF